MPFDPISYLEALKSRKLSNLIVDADKDWGGHIIKNLGEPTEPNDAARKIYVDVAATGLGINYFLLDEADSEVTAYKAMSLSVPELSEAYVEALHNTAGEYEIASWIAPLNGIPLKLGVYELHCQAEIVSGNIPVRLFFRLYERQSGGSEVLIAESMLSDRIDSRRDVIVALVLASDYIMASGSRLVVKLFAKYESGGSSTTVRVYYQGDVRSRLAVPIAKEILDTVYAAKLHAAQHGLGGADELSLDASQITSGVLDLARIPNIDWSRISGNFPRVISDLISSAFSRSWISDFFSSPFWDNIPDKPSTFPPESHTHDDRYYTKTQLQTSGQSSVHWNNITNKPSTYPPSSHTHGVADIIFNGHFVPTANGSYDLGNGTYKLRNGYFTGTVYTGDVEFKNKWRITEYDEDGNVMEDGLRVLNSKGEEIFKITEDGLWFKGKKIA